MKQMRRRHDKPGGRTVVEILDKMNSGSIT